MLQSSASNLLNILSSKPVATDNAVSANAISSPQGTEFNRIYSDVGRQSSGSFDSSGKGGGGVAPHQLDLFAPVDTGAVDANASGLQADTGLPPGSLVELVEGQDVSVSPFDAGNVLPFQLLLSTQSLPQDSTQMAAAENGWQGLTLSSANAAADLMTSGAALALASDTSGADPSVSGPLAFTDPTLLSASDQPIADASELSPLAATASASSSSDLSQTAAGAVMTTVATEDPNGAMVLANAATQGHSGLQSDPVVTDASTQSGPTGQFIPPGLAQAISQGSRAGVKSAALDGVPGQANGLAAQQEQPPEGLDSQWLERIRQFQHAQQGGASTNGSGAYDASTVMDAYLASGDLSLDSGALDADSLFKAVLGDLTAGPDASQDKAIGASTSLNSTTGAQLRSTDPALKTYTTMLPQTVGEDGWIDSMGEKIVWLSGRNIQAAEIHLNPAELGPVEVKVQVQNDQTTVTFTAQHASVRELLEANVNRLREMMEGNGVNLRDVQVGADTAGQQQAFARNGDEAGKDSGHAGSAWSESGDAVESALTEVSSTAISSRNVIDFYA